MPCKTPHDFCEIACSSGCGSFPAPAISRSITNLGIALSSSSDMHRAWPAQKAKVANIYVLRRMSRHCNLQRRTIRDQCPGLTSAGQPAVHPEACITREHNSLVTVSYTDLVEYVRDVVANGFFRKPERGGNLRIIESSCDGFEDGSLARRERVERQ